MSSDRARRTFDPDRRYRSVVSQQGRVTLEADANEADEIRIAESRAELTELVGPSGSPDDGFKISATAGAMNFSIGAGTLYVGGVRVQTRATTWFDQRTSEWLDLPHALPAVPTAPVTESVYLTVTEHEVTAVEDEALREIALGGPDTAARTRMIQRVHRAPVATADCEPAFDTVVKAFGPRTFDPATMQLTSTMQLRVDFHPPPPTVDACQPIAQTGFLGADNQLIRVRVADTTNLVWSYDNASSLYRVTFDPAARSTLKLATVPVDVYHQPRALQWAEVLRPAVKLDDAGSQIAAATGELRRIAIAYDPDAKTIGLASDLPADFPTTAFLRVWENRQPLPATPTAFTELATAIGAGIGVRIYTTGWPTPGDFWMIGVRPSAPRVVLPARLATLQPPDGPRRWLVPLATLAWGAAAATVAVTDCRHKFRNLVELTERGGGCCEVTISHTDPRPQQTIDDAIAQAASHGAVGLHVRFTGDAFTLAAPLVFQSVKNLALVVSGCGMARLIATEQEVVFMFRDWRSVVVTDLVIGAELAGPGAGKKGRPDIFPPAAGDELRHLGGALTFVGCQRVVVERLHVRGGTGTVRAGAAIAVRSAFRARVVGCELSIGAGQVGILLVDVLHATIDDNVLAGQTRQGFERRDPRVRKALIGSMRLVRDTGAPVMGVPGRRALARTRFRTPLGDGLVIDLETHETLETAWTRALAPLKRTGPVAAPAPVPPSSAARRRVRRRIDAVVAQAIDPSREGPLTAVELAPFLAVLAELPFGAGADKGIVVGGREARDVRISNNSIGNVTEGIRVGLSTSDPERFSADRVWITGNTIEQVILGIERGQRCGIFVGNARTTTIRDNRIAADFYKGLRKGDGIRVWGELGPLLIVSGNSTTNGDAGIRIHPIVPPETDPPPHLWLVKENVVLDANDSIVADTVYVTVTDNVTA